MNYSEKEKKKLEKYMAKRVRHEERKQKKQKKYAEEYVKTRKESLKRE